MDKSKIGWRDRDWPRGATVPTSFWSWQGTASQGETWMGRSLAICTAGRARALPMSLPTYTPDWDGGALGVQVRVAPVT